MKKVKKIKDEFSRKDSKRKENRISKPKKAKLRPNESQAPRNLKVYLNEKDE